jgi:hypothetical protein
VTNTLTSIRIILESIDGEPIEIKKLIRSEAGVASANKSFGGGTPELTNNPISVTKTPHGDVILLDGYHRVHAAIKSGETHINAKFFDYDKMKPMLLDERKLLRYGQHVGDENAETPSSLGIVENSA